MLKSRKINRRHFLALSGMTVGSLIFPSFISNAIAKKEGFPSRKMQALIGFSPGGGVDRSARVVTPAWEKTLGTDRSFLFTYKPGAGSLIALRRLIHDPRADGHVVNFTLSNNTAWIFQLQKPDFTLDDIGWVGSYLADPNILLVKKDAKWDRIDQFVEDARKAKKPLTVSVGSPMSSGHAATVVFRELSGANLKVVPFKGGVESRTAVMGGHVDASISPYWCALHTLGLTKAIGIFSKKNPAPQYWNPVQANDVLDFKMPDLYEVFCIQVNGTVKSKYPHRYEKLVTSLREALSTKELREAADKQKLTPFMEYKGPEESRQYVHDYLDMLSKYKPAMEQDFK